MTPQNSITGNFKMNKLITLALLLISTSAFADIKSYLGERSIVDGDKVKIYVSDNEGAFTLTVTKMNTLFCSVNGSNASTCTDRVVAEYNNITATEQAYATTAFQDGAGFANAISYRHTLGEGIFFITLTAPSGTNPADGQPVLTGRDTTTLFVAPTTRGGGASGTGVDIVYYDNVFRQLAYDDFVQGYASYGFTVPSEQTPAMPAIAPLAVDEPAPILSLLKPGHQGANGSKNDGSGSAGSLSQLGRYEKPMLRWMKKEGYNFEVASQVDFEKDNTIFNNYTTIVIAGHHEYCSRAEVEFFKAWVEGGKHIVMSSGNTCWWQINYDTTTQQMEIFKGLKGAEDPRVTGCPAKRGADGRWPCAAVADNQLESTNFYTLTTPDPIQQYTGLTYERGGYSGGITPASNETYWYKNKYGGLWVQDSTHEIFDGTGVTNSVITGYDEDANNFNLSEITGTDSQVSTYVIGRDFEKAAGTSNQSVLYHEVDSVIYTMNGSTRPEADYTLSAEARPIGTAANPIEILAWAPSTCPSSAPDGTDCKAMMIWWKSSNNGILWNAGSDTFASGLGTSKGVADTTTSGNPDNRISKIMHNIFEAMGHDAAGNIDGDADGVVDEIDTCMITADATNATTC